MGRGILVTETTHKQKEESQFLIFVKMKLFREYCSGPFGTDPPRPPHLPKSCFEHSSSEALVTPTHEPVETRTPSKPLKLVADDTCRQTVSSSVTYMTLCDVGTTDSLPSVWVFL